MSTPPLILVFLFLLGMALVIVAILTTITAFAIGVVLWIPLLSYFALQLGAYLTKDLK